MSMLHTPHSLTPNAFWRKICPLLITVVASSNLNIPILLILIKKLPVTLKLLLSVQLYMLVGVIIYKLL